MNREQKPAQPQSWASLHLANRQRSATTGQFISKSFSRQCAQWRQQIRQAGEVTESDGHLRRGYGRTRAGI